MTIDQHTRPNVNQARGRRAIVAGVGALLAVAAASGTAHADRPGVSWSGCAEGAMPVAADVGAILPSNDDPGTAAREALLGGMATGSGCSTYEVRTWTPVTVPSPSTIDTLALAEGDRLYFAVELVATEAAATTPWEVGDTEQRCYTLAGDGTFLNPGFPRPGEPGVGTWQRVDGDDGSTFEARVEVAPLELSMIGTVVEEGQVGELSLTADVIVAVAGAPVLKLTSQGYAVESCPA